jgi:DnaJ-class molecular chaperone
MAKSYFIILGVSPGATANEIKSAHRRLAKEFHPDHYAGGNETFREIQEAYSVLGNTRRRREYEQQIYKKPINVSVKRPTYHPEPEPLIPEPRPIDVGDISPVRSFQTFSPSFDEVFDWLWSNFSSLTRSKSGRIQNVTFEVPLTRNQAFRGGTARVLVPARAVCPTCLGYGALGPYECSRCSGEGDISGEVPVSISFPPGLTKDHAVTIPLDRFGIHNLHMTVLFRPADADDS